MKNLFFIWLTFLAAIGIPSVIEGSVPLSTASALDGTGLAWVSAGCNPKGQPTSVVADTHDGVDAWKTGNLSGVTELSLIHI